MLTNDEEFERWWAGYSAWIDPRHRDFAYEVARAAWLARQTLTGATA